jgi:hypothetical protein
VASRSDDLLEITEMRQQGGKDKGEHRICLISQSSCDPEEAAFLAAEAQRLL